MKLARFAIAATILLPGYASSARPATDYRRTVIAYVTGEAVVPFTIRACGMGLAVNIFREIGVRLEWRHRVPSRVEVDRKQAIVVRITSAPPAARRNVLAGARPFEGSTINVYYDRIQWAEHVPMLPAKLFAHVLAHEIAHVLEGTDRHSDTGILMARWGMEEYADMQRGFLRFEKLDVELIHKGIEIRSARRQARREVGRR